MESTSTVNIEIFQFFNSLFGSSVTFDLIVIFLAEYYIHFLFLGALLFIYKDYGVDSKPLFRLHLLALILILSLVSALAYATRVFYPYPRPFLLYDITHIATSSLYSFPSAHTIVIFGLAVGVYVYNKRFAYFLGVSGLLVGISRVVAGVHYPLDILGGAALGVCVGFIVDWIFRKRRP